MALNNQLVNAVIIGDCDRLRTLLSEFKSFRLSDVENDKSVQQSRLDLRLEEVKDQSGNTLLHLAVLRCLRHRLGDNQTRQTIATNCKFFEILLSNSEWKTSLLSSRNNDGQTPLHLFHVQPIKTYSSPFMKSTIALIYGTEKPSKRINPVEHKSYVDSFFQFAFPPELDHHNFGEQGSIGSNNSAVIRNELLDLVDGDNFTALHLAVKSKCSHCIQQLLKRGASFNINSNHTSFPFVTPCIFHQDPWASNALEQQLNANINFDDFYEESGIGVDEEDELQDNENINPNRTRFGISFDFCGIVPKRAVNSSKPEREMEFIETFLNDDSPIKKQILGHSLVASFVFLKWERVRWMFVWSFLFHIGFAILYTVYTMSVYLWSCPYQADNSTKRTPNITLNPLESRLHRQCDKGLGAFEFSVTLLVGAFILGLLELAKIIQNFPEYRRQWQNLFQICMIISMCLSVWPVRWTDCQCLVGWQYSAAAYGTFHVWSTLLINMGRFPKLGIYVEMFGKVLENFGYFMAAYVFLLIAFSISFCVVFPDEAQSFIFKKDSGDLIHPITSHVLYGAFVILVTIVLTNLLIGLAVDDIKGLTQNAEFTKTTREIANIAYVESIIFWSALPNIGLVRKLRKSIVIARFPKDACSSEKIESPKSVGYIDEYYS
ncbi:Transient receptor potential channel pyrexia [Folsomia candida]|uniref:Transient receptor potential channel pyrexia n=1 Tax=Folsomia candida TaxID=158441 RepID=A0A226ERH4_FOLCA|nr:Transient receptor potential channel pyrexia [Folsomia candida]